MFEKKWSGVSFVLMVVTMMVLPVNVAFAALLTGWKFDPQTNQLEILWDEGSNPSYFLLADPPRIVVDLPNTELGSVTPQQDYGGSVRQIRASQFSPEVTRIVLELAPEIILSPQQVQLNPSSNNRWILQPQIEAPIPPQNGGISPPNNPARSQSPTVTVPPLNPSPIPQNSTNSNTIPIIDFGQPLITNVPSPPTIPTTSPLPLMPHH